jgi:multimeric flavodoxin WrbA
MQKTIALFSSSRRNGNTGRLIDRIGSELKIEIVDLAGLCISPFDYDHRNRDDDFEPLMRRVLTHDQIIFATPIYWYAVSAAMKVFLDRISDFLELPDLLADGRRLRGKSAYVVCTSASAEAAPEFMSAFDETFRYLGMRFGAALHVDCSDGYRADAHDPLALDFAARVRATGSVHA